MVVKDGTTVIPASEYDVSYSNNVQIGTNATVTITAKTGGNYNVSGSRTFTIKAGSAALKDAPKPNDLTYNGFKQELVTPGTAVNGKVVYSTTENGSYSTSIPGETNAGVYQIWYKVQGDNGAGDTEPKSVIVEIKQKLAYPNDIVMAVTSENIEDVCKVIEEKLGQKGFLGNKNSQINDANDLFVTLGIPKTKYNAEPTDLEINQFVKDSFNQVVKLLSQLCQQYQTQNAWVQVQIEQVDTRTVIYQFYRNGQLARGLKLFLSNMLGGGRENIGLSDNTMSFGGGNSWNGMYDAKFIDGELKLYATMSFMNSQKAMTVEEIVADIWEHYIQVYLER